MHGKLFISITLCGLISFFHTNFGSEGQTEELDIMLINSKSAKNQKTQLEILKEQRSPENYQQYKMDTYYDKYHIFVCTHNPEPELAPWNRTLIIKKENIYDYDVVDDKGKSVLKWQYMPITKKKLETMAQAKNVIYLYAYEALAWKKGYDPYLTAKITKTIIDGVATDLKEELPQQSFWSRPIIAGIFGFTVLLIILYNYSR